MISPADPGAPLFRPDPAGYCRQPYTISGRLPFLAAWHAAFQRCDAVNAYHAAAHPRADPTVKSGGVLPPAGPHRRQ